MDLSSTQTQVSLRLSYFSDSLYVGYSGSKSDFNSLIVSILSILFLHIWLIFVIEFAMWLFSIMFIMFFSNIGLSFYYIL